MQTTAEKMNSLMLEYGLRISPTHFKEVIDILEKGHLWVFGEEIYTNHFLKTISSLKKKNIFQDTEKICSSFNLDVIWREAPDFFWNQLELSFDKKTLFFSNSKRRSFIYFEILSGAMYEESCLSFEKMMNQEELEEYRLKKLFEPSAADELLTEKMKNVFIEIEQQTLVNYKLSEMTYRLKKIIKEQYEETVSKMGERKIVENEMETKILGSRSRKKIEFKDKKLNNKNKIKMKNNFSRTRKK